MQGVVAKQDVHFGGNGEVLTLSHETLAPSAYEAGILIALRAVRSARGVIVGLDKLIELTPRDGGGSAVLAASDVVPEESEVPEEPETASVSSPAPADRT
jgi:4-hydroxy-tetrahydrodipicolinate reductase